MVVKFERGLGHLARIVPRGRHATYPTVGHVDTRPGQGTVVARSELANLNRDGVFPRPGPPPCAVCSLRRVRPASATCALPRAAPRQRSSAVCLGVTTHWLISRLPDPPSHHNTITAAPHSLLTQGAWCCR